MANKFDTYYANVAKKLVPELGDTNSKYQDYLKNPNVHSLFLNKIEPGEVLQLLLKMDVKRHPIYMVFPQN